MKQLFITAAAFMLAVTFVYAVDSTKPTYHTSDWEIKHGHTKCGPQTPFYRIGALSA